MTTKPELRDPGDLLPGLVAVALFAVLAWVFAGAPLGDAVGFPDGVSITASIGYAMFNIGAQDAVASEGFLVAFEIIDVVLVAALVAAVMLARREEGGEITTALRSEATEEESTEAVADGGPGGED